MVKIATDSELFIKDGEFILPPSVVTKGTKDSPEPIGGGNTLQQDGASVEFATPVCSSWRELSANITHCIDEIKRRIPQGSEIIHSSVVEVPDFQLEDNPEWSVSGCSLDYHDGEEREPIEFDSNLRFAGGHIHLDYQGDEVNLSRALDKCLYFPYLRTHLSLSEAKRMEFYGLNSVYRSKSYGIEYRSMPNTWVLSEETIRSVWEQVEMAIELANQASYGNTHKEFNKIKEVVWKNSVSFSLS